MTNDDVKQKGHGTLGFVLDFGPLLLFFLASKLGSSPDDPTQGAVIGTGTFMAAIIVAVIVSKVKLGRISPMLKLTAALGVFFGALTIWFHDERFIQIKPTIIYAFFAVLLIGGWFRGKALLKYVLENAYSGLSEQGWRKLSLSWGLFFLTLTFANEIMRAALSFDTWLSLKVWGVTALTFLFAMANIPMLMRHGLKLDGEAEIPPQA
ncbi:MAG: inner membrane-spanning protein YciB [Sphingorhabdus sp.]